MRAMWFFMTLSFKKEREKPYLWSALLTEMLFLWLIILLFEQMVTSTTSLVNSTSIVTYFILVRLLFIRQMDKIDDLQLSLQFQDSVGIFLQSYPVYLHVLSQEFSVWFYKLLTHGLPLYVFGMVFFKGKWTSVVDGMLFLCAMLLSFLLQFHLNYAFSLIAYRFRAFIAMNAIRLAFLVFLTGSFVPLWFYPNGLANILIYLPFYGMIQFPVKLYLGHYDLTETLRYFGLYGAWLFVSYGVVQATWKKTRRHLLEVGN